MALPCTHFSPASITAHLDESIISGTRAISGSDAIRLRNFVMACCESSMASSMLMSITCAPFSTCCRPRCQAVVVIAFEDQALANFCEPVTLVRSPTFTNNESSPMLNGSRPDSRHSTSSSESCAAGISFNGLGNRLDVRWRSTAATAHDVEEAAGCKFLDQLGSMFRRFVIAGF